MDRAPASHVGRSSFLTRAQARAFYDRFGAKQDQQAFYEQPAVDDMLAHAELESAQAVFEFGCGTGKLAERVLADCLPPTAHYVGCDISPTMIGLARRRLARFGERAEVRLVADDSSGLDAPAASFDRFVSTYVVDLLAPEDIERVLTEAHRLLKPAGRLCLASLTHGSTPLSRVVSWMWGHVHRWRPQLVGGCRPLTLTPFVSPPAWRLLHQNVVVAYGIPSEVVVAARQ